MACGFIAVHVAEAGTEVALAQVGVGTGALFGGVGGGQEVVARDIIIKQEWGC